MRRTTRLPLEALAPYLLEVPFAPASEGQSPSPQPFDWQAIFGNDHPVEIEVGFGKGLFLLNAASSCPDVNFVGIEVLRKYQLFTANRVAKRMLRNVRLACADARAVLHNHVVSGSVQAVHVYFPDPWWKKRHHKRRVFTADFVADCARILRPEGLFHIVTDVADYATIIRELLANLSAFVPHPTPAPPTGEGDLDYLTNFERKFRREGRPIHRMCYRRMEPTPA